MNSRYWMTNSRGQSPSWGAVSSLVNQKISSILWNLEVHYHCHKSPPFVQMQSMPSWSSASSSHTLPSSLFKIYFNITHPAMLRSSKWSLSFRFPHQNPGHISLIPSICNSRCYLLNCYVVLTINVLNMQLNIFNTQYTRKWTVY